MIAGLEILNLHAQGGMAEVYRARGKGADGQMWTYAVKRILPEYTADVELRKMFAEEARIASLLVHPNVVRVYDLAKSENDEYFIVMEFLEGRDLAEAIDKANETGRRLPIWLAVHCAREVLRSLIYATTEARDREGNLLGLIHRDISPHNIFVCWDGQVKLTDFGVAKVKQSNVLTQVGVTKGKFGYMSPEQLTSTGLDFRSDLYNVGILLYEVMSCRRLFWGDNPSRFLQAMIKGEVPALEHELGVPDELEALMRCALSRERDERPASAAEFDLALAAIQERHGLHSAGKAVADEWRALFGAEAMVPEPPTPAVDAPVRLASIHAALPDVVARAVVPSVRGPLSRPAAQLPQPPLHARPPLPQHAPPAKFEPSASGSFTVDATFEENRTAIELPAHRPASRKRDSLEPNLPRVRTKSVRALPPVPEEDPQTLPPSNEWPAQRVPLDERSDPITDPEPRKAIVFDEAKSDPRRRTVAKGAGPNAVMLSLDDSWGDDEDAKTSVVARGRAEPRAGERADAPIVAGGGKVVPLPQKKPSSPKKPKR
jgi:serine/threonine protein kinase